MNVTDIAPSSGAPTKDLFSGEDQTQTFLLLLVTQMKNQDPLNPQDPTQFVSQLADFSSLEQLLQIRKSVDALASAASTPSAGDAG
ncbi:MAG: hypothetical protein GC160_28755 [Acidobacteria bacterium]|nr:hypothetical protein [Acidobacteriota bacterium]